MNQEKLDEIKELFSLLKYRESPYNMMGYIISFPFILWVCISWCFMGFIFGLFDNVGVLFDELFLKKKEKNDSL